MPQHRLVVPRGVSRTVDVPIVDAAGAPINLTGATVLWWVGKTPNSVGDDVVIKKSMGQGISQIAGGVRIFILPADTEDRPTMPAGTYYHECKVTLGDGTRDRVIHGPFVVEPTLDMTP